MHLKSCYIVLLLALVTCQAAPSPKIVDKKSIETKLTEDNLTLDDTGADKDRAKKSATTFCVEVRGEKNEQESKPVTILQPVPMPAPAPSVTILQPAPSPAPVAIMQPVPAPTPAPLTIIKPVPAPVQIPVPTVPAPVVQPTSCVPEPAPRQLETIYVQPVPQPAPQLTKLVLPAPQPVPQPQLTKLVIPAPQPVPQPQFTRVVIPAPQPQIVPASLPSRCVVPAPTPAPCVPQQPNYIVQPQPAPQPIKVVQYIPEPQPQSSVTCVLEEEKPKPVLKPLPVSECTSPLHHDVLQCNCHAEKHAQHNQHFMLPSTSVKNLIAAQNPTSPIFASQTGETQSRAHHTKQKLYLTPLEYSTVYSQPSVPTQYNYKSYSYPVSYPINYNSPSQTYPYSSNIPTVTVNAGGPFIGQTQSRDAQTNNEAHSTASEVNDLISNQKREVDLTQFKDTEKNEIQQQMKKNRIIKEASANTINIGDTK